jgi:P27 family predicted phage terminase small subunit
MTRGRHPAKRGEQQSVATLTPSAPLVGAALVKFGELTAMLAANNMLYPTSADAITRYCQLWTRNQRAVEQIERDGPTITADNGTVKRHPACGEADSTEKAMMAISREIGLTSIAAGRIGGGPSDAEADALADFVTPN